MGADAASVRSEDSTLLPNQNLRLTFRAIVRPSSLSRHALTPIALDLDGRIGMADRSPVPAVEEFALDLDRHITIDARGLPVCSGSRRESRSDDLESRCPGAIVGRGRVGFQIQLPERLPSSVKTKLVVVNGGDRGAGNLTLYAAAFLTQPITTSFVMPITVSRRPQGNQLILEVPELANGAGSLTDLNVRLKRGFRRNGGAASLLTASCPSGTLGSGATALFVDGWQLQTDTLQKCSPRSPSS